jgi:hypothetical protein
MNIVISNCVVNLVPDKQGVFCETGEVCMSDIFTDCLLPAAHEDTIFVGDSSATRSTSGLLRIS